jgi:tellurite resistance-related uncharacterized protein
VQLTYKQFVIRITLVFVLVLGAFAGFVYASDPYVYYHKGGIYKRTFVKNFNMRYQIAGLLRNLDYQTVFVGTSMAHNFKEESINRLFNTQSLNATISGSSAREQRSAVELALASKDVDQVFWEINYDSLAGEPDRIDATFPKYLYDRNVLNDLPYLLSTDALKKIDFQIKNQENVNMDTDPYSFYKFGDKKKPLTVEGMEKELEGISAPPQAWHNTETYVASFKENMLEMVKQNPDVEFTFFYTPYPITRHIVIQETAPQINQDRLDTKLEIFNELSHYKNVKVYDFQDEKEITYNVANYMDRSHYFSFINEWMLEQMATNDPIQTAEDYTDKVNNLWKQLKAFTPRQLVENNEQVTLK